MALKEWTAEVPLAMNDGIDWDRLAETVHFVSQRVPEPSLEWYSADMSDRRVEAETFQELRAEVEPLDTRGGYISIGVSNKAETFHAQWSLGVVRRGHSYVRFDGTDQDKVLGAAAALQKHLDQWDQRRANSDDPKPGPIRRQLTDPNPWVLTIGGAIFAALITLVGLVTDWFGLAG